MEIRAVTCFVPLGDSPDERTIERAGELGAAAREALDREGYPVQTVRLAMQPFPTLWDRPDGRLVLEYARRLEELTERYGIDYVSLGVVPAGASVEWVELLAEVLVGTERVFAGVHVGTEEGPLEDAVRSTARVIRALAHGTPMGFGNLRLGALACCPPGIPFFPAAYHDGGEPRYALALETAGLAVEVFAAADSPERGCAMLREELEARVGRMIRALDGVGGRFGFAFGGVDASLAPYPSEERSTVGAIESLTGRPFGSAGTLEAVGKITAVLQHAKFPRCGFCGVMLPVLEDAVLARRCAEGRFGLDALLLYSAVCGTGLDTIPLPGDVDEADLAAVLRDVAMLAARGRKPLTARLMPIPGAEVGDWTAFSFSYFANTRVMDLPGRLAGD